MRYLWAFSLLLAVAVTSANAETITISAAISLKDSLTEIAPGFAGGGGDKVVFNFGASGLLAAQITQGAPADAFISAGKAEMDQLAAQNLIDPASRRDVCSNELVLIVPADAAFVPGSIYELTDARIHRIAIGQPKIVPAGRYAEQVFDHLKIASQLNSKLVFGENVSQVLELVERGELDAGVVYATDAAGAGVKVRVAAKADGSMHDPIVYPAAVTKPSAHAETSRRFLDYLTSPAARKILAVHGFVAAAPSTVPSP